MNNNYSLSSLKGLLPGRRWLLLLSLVFLTANVFGQARNYQFGQSSAAYTEITGGTVSTATGDDGTQVITMPFPFTYAGAAVTDITIGTNGFVRMAGGSIFSSNWTNSLTSTASLPVLAPFWDDHNLGTGTIVYNTTGTAPNRQFVIEFRNLVTSGTGDGTATSRARFKVTLFETSNQIVYHYGTSTVTTTISGSIGMNSSPGGVGQFLSVTPGVNATSNTSVANDAIVTLPDSGVVYTFTPSPAACNMPWAISSSNVLQTGFTISWRNTGSTSYRYVVGTSATLPTGTGTLVSDTFAAVTGLVQNTAYYVYVRSACTGGTNSGWAGPVLVNTGGPVSSVASGLWSNPLTWSTGAVPNAASAVTISANDSVIFDLATGFAASLQVNGVLGVNAAAQRILTVAGNVNVTSSGSLNFGVPTTGTSARIIDLTGNFSNAGNSNMANGNAAIRYIGTTPQTFTNTGALLNNAVGQLLISNAAGVTLASPVTVGFNLDLIAGVLTAGNNLTFDQLAVTGTSSQVRRSPLGSLVGTPTITSTVHNVQYVFFTGQTSTLITEGPEIPASRTINALTINNPAGLNLTGNLTLTAAASALTLTSGIINLPAGNKIICSNPANAPTVGSATSFVNGGFEVVVSSGTATTRNFPVGSVVTGVPVRGHVVIASIITGATTPQSVTVMPAGTPSGGGVSPMGPRSFEITATGSIGTTATVALNWDAREAVTFAGSLANIRIVQASALTGAWTARSVSATTGSLTGVGTRTTTAINLTTGGNLFAWGSVASGDVAVTNITSPVSGACFGASETVVAVLRNEGASIDRSVSNITVKGTVTTPSGTIINLNNVVRNTGTFAIGQTDTIIFTNALNMVDSGNYVISVFIDSLTASLRTNDTLARVVRSDAWTARANPAIIVTSQSSVVEVLRNGVAATAAGVLPRNTAAVRLSELIVFRTGTGTQPIYPSYIPAAAQDFLEITNFGDTAANIGGWNLEIFGTGARTYAFPAGTVLPAGGVLILHIGSGTDDVANRYYNTGGANDALFSTSTAGITLRNGSTLVDAVAFRGYAFPTTAGVSATDWSGNSPATSSAGLMLVNFDNNNGSNWVVSTSTLFTSIGTFNPNMSFVSRNVSWTGPSGFTATGYTAPTGTRNTGATELYTATISGGASCVRTAVATLQVVIPVTPVAGFSRSSNTATTGAVVSTVTLTDTSLNIPFVRRWTITPNTVTFVNGTNDSSIAPQVQFTAVGSYSVKLRVSNPAGTDSVTLSNAVNVVLGYCASNATSTGDTKIDSVRLGTALTGSASNTCQAYTNFADSLGVVAVITKTQPFPMMVRSGYCGTTGYAARGRVFIDFNKDGSFTENEAVADFGPLTATGTASAREWFSMNLIVPVSADTGIARLRVVYSEGSGFATVLGCGTYGFGETEDYLVRITNPIIANPVLASPANSTLLNVNGPDQVRVNINWTRATRFTGTGAPATYTWQLASRAAGNFNTPLLSLASNNAGADTALTLSIGQLDAALTSLSVAVGDTVKGIWRVRAISGTDTVFSPQTWNIDIRRGTVTEAVTAFSLVTPPNNTILSVEGPGSQTAQIRWTRPVVAGTAPVTYQWLATGPGGNFNTPLATLNANGSDTSLTLSYTAIDALLASLNVNVGDSARLDWTVRVNSGTFTRLATQTWRITMVRGGIAPLRFAIAPVANGGTTGVRAPNGTSGHTFFRAASFVPASELAAAGIQSGATITGFALRTTTGADAPARGKMSLYLSNGQNTTYTRGTAWTGAIAGLNLHHDDSVSIQTGAGTMLLQFSQPFVYTGGSIELAYEWNGSAPFATVAAVYAANTAIAASLVSGASATAAPATLAATAFRPEFTWGVDDRKANEIEVITMFAKGRNPLNYGTPEVVQAIVRNNGYQVRNNVPVTLSVAGPNNFTQFNVQTITRLAIDATQLVTFSPINGSTLGYNNMTVSVPADDVAANNTKRWAQEQTDSIFSYNDSVTVGNSSVGYNTGSGLLLSRFSINGTRSIAAARIRIGEGAAIAGNSVSAVVLNESGVIVSQSAPVALTAADLRTWVVFPFTAPANVTNGNFYIGLAQTANATTGYFPVAFQAETPTRANAYFTAPLAGGVVPSPVAGFRLMIEAHVGPQFIPADTLSRFNLVAPSNNTTLNIQGDPTQTAQIRWRTSTRTGGIGTTTYQWLLDVPAGDFSNPVLRVNAGTDTSLTLTYGQIVDSLAAKGVQVGSGFAGRWNVLATNGPVSRLANIPFIITLNRGVMTSIEETDFSKSISLYPNPAAYSAKLQINTPGDKELSIVIVNAVGQEMKKFNVSSSIANDIELDLTSLNQGLYFVRVTNGSEMAIKRLMIQR
jgi:hypothetical protein